MITMFCCPTDFFCYYFIIFPFPAQDTNYQFNFRTDVLHQEYVQEMTDSTGPEKNNRVTKLPHHEDFRCCDRIASLMPNTVTSQGPLQSPSSQHHPQPYCSFVQSGSPYFTRNCTIYMERILLRGSHRNKYERNVNY